MAEANCYRLLNVRSLTRRALPFTPLHFGVLTFAL